MLAAQHGVRPGFREAFSTYPESTLEMAQDMTPGLRTASGGDEEAKIREEFSAIAEEYSDYVYNVALRLTHDTHEAEDITQEAFLSAYRGYRGFRGQSRVSTWLYRITVNAFFMKIRKQKTREKYLVATGYDDAVVVDWSNNPEKCAINGELRALLQRGLNQLSPELRATVVLRDIQGLSTEDAAEVLEISTSALKSRLHRARAQVRKFLESYRARPA